jgi:hypothetical protein
MFRQKQDDALARRIAQSVEQAFASAKGFRDIAKGPFPGFSHE